MSKNEPYLSIVLVSRNDEHGQNLLRRTQVCLDGMIAQMEKYEIPSELVLVEWLPPKNKPLLKDIYPWPKSSNYCNVRVIVVRPEDVGGYTYSDDYSIRDLTPWNVGIRRAKGTFILSTVTDVLLSDELARAFQSGKLKDKTLYRIDRCDVNRGMLDIGTLAGQLEYCQKNIIDMHTLNPLKFITKPMLPILHDKAPGDFILLSRECWHALHGFPQGILGGGDNIMIYMAHFSGAKQEILKKPMHLYHIDHDSKWKNPEYVYLRKLFIRCKLPFAVVDVLSRILSGLVSRLFPSKSLAAKKNLQLYSSKEIHKIIMNMSKGRRSLVYNDESWGLKGSALEEFTVTERTRE